MCGIVAVKSNKRKIEVQPIEKALSVLRHRGPDAQGIYKNNNQKTVLGHVRLSIIGLDNGAQPLVNNKHHLSAVVNGEFYGYKDIKLELQQKGYQFQTNSDSEIILFLYLEYGLDMFKYLRGEFAFVLFDETKDLILAARDRFGIKPLCYFQDENEILIASKAKALFELGVPKAFDEYSLMHAAHMQYQPTDRTLFKGIFQLAPGHYMIWQKGSLHIQKYWDLNYKPSKQIVWEKSEQDYIEEFKALFCKAVQLRLTSEVPVCCHLSGGLDSSAVAGVASKVLNRPLTCFTISFDKTSEYDEFHLAKETADFCNSTLYKINVTSEDIFQNLKDAVYFSEGLAINGHISCKYLLNKAIAKAGFKVALTGEGSDEVLAGYPHLRQDIFNALPACQREKLVNELYKSNLVCRGIQVAQGETLDIGSVQERLGFIPSFLKAKASLGFKIRRILSDDFMNAFENTDFYGDMLDAYDIKGQLRGRHHVNQSSYLWTKLTLANYILGTLGDGCEMASSIEGRLPFLDHKVFEFAKDLPLEMKIKNTNEKYILKEAVKPFITNAVYKRQKHPFMAPPITRFQTTKNKQFIKDILTSDSFKSMPYFDNRKILKLLDHLDDMDTVQLTAFEPVIMFLLTTIFIKESLLS